MDRLAAGSGQRAMQYTLFRDLEQRMVRIAEAAAVVVRDHRAHAANATRLIGARPKEARHDCRHFRDRASHRPAQQVANTAIVTSTPINATSCGSRGRRGGCGSKKSSYCMRT